MCMGKGGVGKTTVASAVALELAARGHDVLLTTTDPAAHLNETLQAQVQHLTVERIDPRRAITEYRSRVMAGKGKSLDDAGRAALAEDLKSPCTDEVAVFQQFSHVVFQAASSSSSSIPRLPATPCSCLMPPGPTTARSPGR